MGELQKRKGLKYLLAALELLKSEGQDYQFVAVGEGPEQDPLRQYAREKGFADRVQFAGVVPLGQRLFEEYRQADLFVLPSIAAEGVPRVIQEAQALGCPVVATDIGSTAWQLRDGAGIVVPPYDAHALKDAILRVLADNGLRESLSRRGHVVAAQHSFEKQSAGIADFVHARQSPRRIVGVQAPLGDETDTRGILETGATLWSLPAALAASWAC